MTRSERQEILEARVIKGKISNLLLNESYSCDITDQKGLVHHIVTVVPDFTYTDDSRGTIVEFVGAKKTALNMQNSRLLEALHDVVVLKK